MKIVKSLFLKKKKQIFKEALVIFSHFENIPPKVLEFLVLKMETSTSVKEVQPAKVE